MHPYLFGDYPAYPIFLAVAIVGAASVAWASFRRHGIPLGDSLRILLSLAAGGLLGAKLYAVFEDTGPWRFLLSDPAHGYRYPGAIVGVAVVLVLFHRRLCRDVSLAALGDALMPAVGVGAALLRFGCFAAGCCFGAPARLPWAVRFPAQSPGWTAQLTAGWITPSAPASLPVHPLQLYFMVLSLSSAALALWLEPRKVYEGQVVLAFLALDQLGKFLLEYLRDEPLPGVQVASLLLGLAAVATLFIVAAYPQSLRAQSRQAAVVS